MMRKLRKDETEGLIHVHILGESAVQKDISNIDESNGPSKGDEKRKNKANSGGLDQRAIYAAKVNAMFFGGSLMQQIELCINRWNFAFEAKDPFVVNYVHVRAWGNECPSVITE